MELDADVLDDDRYDVVDAADDAILLRHRLDLGQRGVDLRAMLLERLEEVDEYGLGLVDGHGLGVVLDFLELVAVRRGEVRHPSHRPRRGFDDV